MHRSGHHHADRCDDREVVALVVGLCPFNAFEDLGESGAKQKKSLVFSSSATSDSSCLMRLAWFSIGCPRWGTRRLSVLPEMFFRRINLPSMVTVFADVPAVAGRLASSLMRAVTVRCSCQGCSAIPRHVFPSLGVSRMASRTIRPDTVDVSLHGLRSITAGFSAVMNGANGVVEQGHHMYPRSTRVPESISGISVMCGCDASVRRQLD